MLERLIEVVSNVGEAALPFQMMRPFEAGVILRAGVFHRLTKPGYNWKIPFFEEILSDNVVSRTTDLRAQSLVTSDGKSATVRVVATWRISDIKKALLAVDGVDDVVKDTYYSAVGEAVSKNTFSDLNARQFLTALRKECQRRADDYGVEVIRVALAELSECSTVRLIHK